MTITIRIHERGGSYHARAIGCGKTASCTMGARHAAERCARKVFPDGGIDFIEVTPWTYLASVRGRGDQEAASMQGGQRAADRPAGETRTDTDVHGPGPAATSRGAVPGLK